MKSIGLIYLLFATICAQACANNSTTAGNDKPVAVSDTAIAAAPAPTHPDSFAVGKVIDTVVCTGDATQSYALYIPARGGNTTMPVIYFFDPHASGSLPLHKYQSLADSYGFIMVGSNNSKNGNDWSKTEAIWQTLWNDTRQRLRINTGRVYTAGFSGGAKVAGYVAIKFPGIKGVIANGAGLPDGAPASNYPFSFTAVAGEGDMNMTDLVAINAAFDKTPVRHRILLFNGKHEWAPVKTMNTAFTGLQFDAMFNHVLPADTAFIKTYVANSKQVVTADTKTNNLVKAVAECTLSVNLLQGLTNEVNWFTQKAAALAGNAVYKQQLLSQQQLLEKEQGIKAQYMQQFQQGDMNYWTKEIASLQTKAKAPTAEAAMDQRLLAYLSLAFYSISNQLISNNQNEMAEHFVTLYKLADPTNSEAWYFSAILHARNHEAPAAESDLLKAVAVGFTDKVRMRAQPEFQQLPVNFSKIENNLRPNAQSLKPKAQGTRPKA